MQTNSDEIFPITDEEGRVKGKATRAYCHGGSMAIHPVVHLHVLDTAGRLYLQKRSANKDIQPGRWDTSVGGHVDYGESITQALRREAREELGLIAFEAVPLRPYLFQSPVERELVNPHYTVIDTRTTVTPDPDEVDEGRFWTAVEIGDALGKGILTPNFEDEYLKLRELFPNHLE